MTTNRKSNAVRGREKRRRRDALFRLGDALEQAGRLAPERRNDPAAVMLSIGSLLDDWGELIRAGGDDPVPKIRFQSDGEPVSVKFLTSPAPAKRAPR